jgi:hypothetical protein
MHTKFWSGKLKRRYCLEGAGVHGTLILKWLSGKENRIHVAEDRDGCTALMFTSWQRVVCVLKERTTVTDGGRWGSSSTNFLPRHRMEASVQLEAPAYSPLGNSSHWTWQWRLVYKRSEKLCFNFQDLFDRGEKCVQNLAGKPGGRGNLKDQNADGRKIGWKGVYWILLRRLGCAEAVGIGRCLQVHRVTTQNTFIFTAVRTSHLTWICLARDTNQWRPLMNTETHLCVTQKAGCLLTSRATSSFSRTTHLSGVTV